MLRPRKKLSKQEIKEDKFITLSDKFFREISGALFPRFKPMVGSTWINSGVGIFFSVSPVEAIPSFLFLHAVSKIKQKINKLYLNIFIKLF